MRALGGRGAGRAWERGYAHHENAMDNDIISLVIGRRVCRQSFARKRTMLRLAVFLAVLLLVRIPQGEGKKRSKLTYKSN